MQMFDYSKKLLNRLDRRTLHSAANLHSAFQNGGAVAGALMSSSSAIPSLYQVGTALSTLTYQTEAQEFRNCVLQTYERLLGIEYLSMERPQADDMYSGQDKVLESIHKDLHAEQLSNVPLKQAVTGWRFAVAPQKPVSDENSELVLNGMQIHDGHGGSYRRHDPLYSLTPGRWTTNKEVSIVDLFENAAIRSESSYPELIDFQLQTIPTTSKSHKDGDVALPSYMKDYFGTKLQVKAVRLDKASSPLPFNSDIVQYKVSVTAPLPDSSILTTSFYLAVDQKGHYNTGHYSQNKIAGSLTADGNNVGTNICTSVFGQLRAQYYQDSNNQKFWSENQVPLLDLSETPLLDKATRVVFPYEGVVCLGTVFTWPVIFTHEVIKALMPQIGFVPSRKMSEAVTTAELDYFINRMSESWTKFGIVQLRSHSFEEEVFVPSKYSMEWKDGVEPTEEDVEKASYLRVNYRPENGSSFVAQIQWFWKEQRFKVVPIEGYTLTHRTVYFILKSYLAVRTARTKQIEQQRSQELND